MSPDRTPSPKRKTNGGRAPCQISLRNRVAWGLLALLGLHAASVKADIWGYVDADRIPHFASTRIDDRYELLLRDSEAVEPFRRTNPVISAPAEAVESADNAVADATLAPASFLPPPVLPAAVVPPRLAGFFEDSQYYKTISPLLREASETHGIDYSLLKALIATESGFNPHAVSPKGAVGLMQLIPPTAARYGVTGGKNVTIAKKLTDPKTNIKAGARYLADLIRMFPGRLELALAAYNAGEGAVQRAGNKIPNYPETRKYVKTVMQLYAGLAPQPLKSAPGRGSVELQRGKLNGGAPSPAYETANSALAGPVLHSTER